MELSTAGSENVVSLRRQCSRSRCSVDRAAGELGVLAVPVDGHGLVLPAEARTAPGWRGRAAACAVGGDEAGTAETRASMTALTSPWPRSCARARLGVRGRVAIDWNSKDAELSSGTINCIWNGFTYTGRENDYTFSDPYVDNSIVMVEGRQRHHLASRTSPVRA